MGMACRGRLWGFCWRGGCGRGLRCAVVGGALGVVGADPPRLVWVEGKRGRVRVGNDTMFLVLVGDVR